jgi:diadenosine tetraphosphatase ApaH/serine/threonine PP2A family protein phosphatase/Ca2+-binding EF-hand superfamily protein
LFAVINEVIFVVHGGLFHNDDITLADLVEVDRTKFTLEDLPENGETIDPISRFNHSEFCKQLTRDALWSDPIDCDGLHESVRGAGVAFGPDITKLFLQRNNLRLVIRSHECIRSGYDEPFASEMSPSESRAPLLCTIFSASDYGGAGNSAAYMIFHVKPSLKEAEKGTRGGEDDSDRFPYQRGTSTQSLDGGMDSTGSGSARGRKNSFRRSLSLKNEGTNELFSPMTPGDNISDVKYIEESSLYYQVHYFYASPLTFDTMDPEGAGPGSISYANSPESVYDLSSMGSAGSNNATDRSRITGNSRSGNQNEMKDAHLSSVISPSQLSSSHKSPRKESRVVSFGGTTMMVDENQEKEKHFILDIDPTKELLQDRNIVLGSTITIDELILTRKTLLLEAFERLDIENKGLVHYKDWIKIMSEIINISVSWRKMIRHLVREEEKVLMEAGATAISPLISSPVGVPLETPSTAPPMKVATPKYEKLGRVGQLRNGVVSGEENSNKNGSVSSSVKTFNNGIIEKGEEENYFVKYYEFLSRYEDDEVKQKKLEQENFTIQILKRYQSSGSQSSLIATPDVLSPESNKGEAGEKEEERKDASSAKGQLASVSSSSTKPAKEDLISVKEYDRLYGNNNGNNSNKEEAKKKELENGSTVVSGSMSRKKSKEEERKEKVDDFHYYGYLVPEYIISFFYTNYRQLEDAFNLIDENKDGFFSLADLTKVHSLLNLNDLLSSDIINYPMIRNIHFSPELIMKLIDINEQNLIDMNSFFEIFRLSILNKLYDIDGSSKPLLARETSYSMELHRLTHSGSLSLPGYLTPSTSHLLLSGGPQTPSPSSATHVHPQHQSALSSLELKKGVEISVDNELIQSNDTSVGLSIDI